MHVLIRRWRRRLLRGYLSQFTRPHSRRPGRAGLRLLRIAGWACLLFLVECLHDELQLLLPEQSPGS